MEDLTKQLLEQIDTIQARVDTLFETLKSHERQIDTVRTILRDFYLAPVSVSSLQPVLELAVLLNPELNLVDRPTDGEVH